MARTLGELSPPDLVVLLLIPEFFEQAQWGVLYPDGMIAIVPWEQPRAGRDPAADDKPV